MATKLTHAEAAEYVWTNSQTIRDWYTTEHHFDLDDHDRSEYRTSGASAPGDIISSIIQDGITDGIITENDDGEYMTGTVPVLCDDPYQQGCKERADYYRSSGYPDRPDQAEYLCAVCFEAQELQRDINIQEGREPDFAPEEWTRGSWVEV